LISIPTDKLDRLLETRPAGFSGGLMGIEKESLRVGNDGVIAQTPHPVSIGSALMHPWITTDYSEALLELITPPFVGPDHALDFLAHLQQFVYQRLDDELLWSGSMPCVVQGEEGIPIARYGHSNMGMMKTVYRRGLGYRYGKVMQVIAGTHFNYSFSLELWPAWQAVQQDTRPLQAFISDQYFHTIRNLLRYGWLVPYLFGASPAVCKSFLCGQPSTRLEAYNENTFYGPYATSLRMCDIGYQNSREAELGFKADYDNVDAYVASLSRAISTPCPRHAEIGVKVAGEYRQLNANMLQIENEYYSSVRPKQLLVGNEKPIHALARRGVRYVELRSLDINPFDPRGIDETQCRFLETFMLFCLLADSPLIGKRESREIDVNLDAVCYRGREPGLSLVHDGDPLPLRKWGTEICDSMVACAELLDARADGTPYSDALQVQLAAVQDANLTCSARVLAQMDEHGEGFFHFAKRMSLQHQRYFLELEPDIAQTRALEASVIQSLEDQQALELSDKQSFDDFLAEYFAQTV
jgi:glutamate--cysteine ligase